MRPTQKKFSLENETHQPASNYCKLQPILEPGNHEKLHNLLRVFVHFVFLLPAKCHKIITFLSYALLSSVALFSFQRRYSTMPARSFEWA